MILDLEVIDQVPIRSEQVHIPCPRLQHPQAEAHLPASEFTKRAVKRGKTVRFYDLLSSSSAWIEAGSSQAGRLGANTITIYHLILD